MGLTEHVIDIYSKGEYPSSALSNFAEYHFTLDGVPCGSMEGFLQSLKYREPAEQARVCSLVGKEAKRAGEKKRLWKLTKKVWWQGQAYGLFSDELQRLIDRAYHEMFEQSSTFRRALAAAGDRELVHTMGKKDMRTTILTEYQFVRRLEALREKARDAEPAAVEPRPAPGPFKRQWVGDMVPRKTGSGENIGHSGGDHTDRTDAVTVTEDVLPPGEKRKINDFGGRKMKTLVSLVLVLTMCLALGAPALAEPAPSGDDPSGDDSGIDWGGGDDGGRQCPVCGGDGWLD